MTVNNIQTVIELLEEEPDFKVYYYTNAHSGEKLYACFPRGQHDDIYSSPGVAEPIILLYNRRWTRPGRDHLELRGINL